MSVELVTGHSGSAHITSEQLGAFNAGVIGTGTYILPTGDRCACRRSGSNTVVVLSGDIVCQGRQVHITGSNTLRIENGVQGQKRTDYIGIQYTRNSQGIERATLKVVRGRSGYSATPMSFNQEGILKGETDVFCPLYEIDINGIDVKDPEPVVDELYTMGEMRRALSEYVENERRSLWHISTTTDARNRPGLRLSRKDGNKEYLLLFGDEGEYNKLQLWDVNANKSVWAIR